MDQANHVECAHRAGCDHDAERARPASGSRRTWRDTCRRTAGPERRIEAIERRTQTAREAGRRKATRGTDQRRRRRPERAMMGVLGGGLALRLLRGRITSTDRLCNAGAGCDRDKDTRVGGSDRRVITDRCEVWRSSLPLVRAAGCPAPPAFDVSARGTVADASGIVRRKACGVKGGSCSQRGLPWRLPNTDPPTSLPLTPAVIVRRPARRCWCWPAPACWRWSWCGRWPTMCMPCDPSTCICSAISLRCATRTSKMR